MGAALARGLELEARAARGPWSGSGSWAILHTEVLDPGLASDATFAEGEALLRRPGHSGALTARYTTPDASVALTLNAVGKREDVDFAAGFPAPRVTLDPYTTLDLAAEYRLPVGGPDTRLLLRIDNIAGAEYQAIAGFPGEGRLVRVGARMRTR